MVYERKIPLRRAIRNSTVYTPIFPSLIERLESNFHYTANVHNFQNPDHTSFYSPAFIKPLTTCNSDDHLCIMQQRTKLGTYPWEAHLNTTNQAMGHGPLSCHYQHQTYWSSQSSALPKGYLYKGPEHDKQKCCYPIKWTSQMSQHQYPPKNISPNKDFYSHFHISVVFSFPQDCLLLLFNKKSHLYGNKCHWYKFSKKYNDIKGVERTFIKVVHLSLGFQNHQSSSHVMREIMKQLPQIPNGAEYMFQIPKIPTKIHSTYMHAQSVDAMAT